MAYAFGRFPTAGKRRKRSQPETPDGTASSFIIDPSNFERESNGAGQYLSGWIPLNNGFNNSITQLVPWWQGGLALLGYGIVLATAGALTTLRSDVT